MQILNQFGIGQVAHQQTMPWQALAFLMASGIADQSGRLTASYR